MPDRPNADREDRARNEITDQDVGTAASASVAGEGTEATDSEKGITAAGGAAGGAAAGLTAGFVTLGPIGSVIGAIAGAVGGGWAGMASGQAAEGRYSGEHDEEYRAHYDAAPDRAADRSFEDTRLAYQLGHFAAANPDYAGRSFDEIEPDLRRGWTGEVQQRHGSWEGARPYARAAYDSRRESSIGRGFVDMKMGGTASHQRPSFSDPIPPGDPDGVAGEGPIPGREQ